MMLVVDKAFKKCNSASAEWLLNVNSATQGCKIYIDSHFTVQHSRGEGMVPSRGLLVSLVLSTLAGCAYAQQPAAIPAPQRAPDTMEARTLACVGCHGDKGRGVANVYFPRLAGKPSGYLYNQLVAFQEGRRRYAPMNYLLAYLPPAYLKQMADYFAAQSPDPIAVTAPAAPAATRASKSSPRVCRRRKSRPVPPVTAPR
jgi:cytochrome c553